MSRNPALRLRDIRKACLKVLDYTASLTKEAFLSDGKTFDAVMRNLEIIGEAVRGIPPAMREANPDVEWRKIAGFRDVAIHEYPTIDEDVVWDIISMRVPVLLAQVEHILAAEAPESSG